MFLPIFFILFAGVKALPQGAPEKVCRTMLPFHGGGIPPQTGLSPYQIEPEPNYLGAAVTITAPNGQPFEGFMLQAKSPDGTIIGTFDPVGDIAHTMNCDGGTGNSLTHSQTQGKNVLRTQWHKNQYGGPVVFNMTVAQDYLTFWVGVESQKILPSSDNANPNLPPLFTPTTPSTTTLHFVPDTTSESSTEFEPFYNGCDVKKSCFGSPEGCVKKRNCKAVAAITVYGDRYEIELKAGSSAAWVGLGLSEDTQMGDDSVVECVKEQGRIRAYMSRTTPRPSLGVMRLQNQQGIQLLSSSNEDGSLYCRVQRDARTTVNGNIFDLVNGKFHLLVAAGSKLKSNSVGFHDLTYLASGEKKNLADVSAISGASKLLLRLHGALMLAAWIGTASLGILMARYFKQTWIGSTMCGKDLWFAWHRFFMVTTWTLTTAGFVLIFVELKAWSTERNPHAILGIITTVLCFIQPIGAYFRPHPGTPKRPIFNWLHWLGGNVAYIVAIVTIFFAVRLNKAELPEWMYWILVAFVAFHVVVHLLLSIMGCASERSAERRVTSFPMKDLSGSGRTSAYSDRSSDAPFSTARKIVLAFYVSVVLAVVVVLIFIVVVAPVEEFWNSIKSSVQTQN